MRTCDRESLVKILSATVTAKIKIELRNILYEYGLPVKTKAVTFVLNYYTEWWIGCGIITGNEEKIQSTSLKKIMFIGADGRKKVLCELPLWNQLTIKQTHPNLININNTLFEEFIVKYLLLIYRFGDYEIAAEIITEEKHYAVGIMPMLYLCFPNTKLQNKTPFLGRTAETKEIADFIITIHNAYVFLRVLRLLSILSAAHRHNIPAIIQIIPGRL
ncbi:MAG: R.Pab1 family restriction endonuclease [Helicobacteraceae bacterium]|nr:R.Pab1 family restriction endonuclease [Helicobacteraceae bacterium]